MVTDPLNVGTYNFHPPSDILGHGIYDVIPYIFLGNVPGPG